MKLQHTKVIRPINRLVQRQLLKANKNAPTLLLVGGIAAGVGATVLACKATLKLDDTLTRSEVDSNRVKYSQVPPAKMGGAAYSEKDRAHDLTVIKIRTAGEIAKLYAPAVGVGIVSILCLTKSHSILLERNTALVAAYSALDYGFREYRRRVVDEFGEEKDLEFRHGAEPRLIVEETDKGPKTKQVMAFSTDKPSMYAVIFDEKSKEWKRTPEYNLNYIRCQQTYFNHKLRATGHVFLNEVYDALGLERTMPGSVVGWWWDGDGDNYIDFGVFDSQTERAKAFVHGAENSVLLDFNVDGIIYDKLQK